jgi:threonine aldolase
MGNLISAMIHCQDKGDAIVLGNQSHMKKYERANLASIGSIYPLTVKNNKDGTLDLDELVSLLEEFKPNDVHLMKIRAVCLESS